MNSSREYLFIATRDIKNLLNKKYLLNFS